ncbi:MAG TPA: outer membrane lipoprotein carrier protein LolA [Bryobacteraceae bacterium]|nr:outer membrane lipoprotein carrier protein LolA [Bryobacteraceae bacterium]
MAFAGDPLSDVFARMDQEAKSFKGLTADINDSVYTALIKDTSTETGIIKVKRPKPGDTRVLIEFREPAAKMVLIAGGEVKLYFPKANLEQDYDVANRRNLIDQALLLGFGATSAELRASYEVSYVGAENISGQATSHIKLIPKSKEVLQQLKQAELWISDALSVPVQQKFQTSAAGDYRLVTYSNIKLNPSLSDKDMRLNPAKGVQIQKMGK